MVSFTTLTLAVVAAAVTGAQAQRAPFSKPCNAPYDVCGWTLANGEFNYDPEVLKNATKAAGQNPNIGTIVYDSIYNCQANGVIAWNRHCDNGCNAAQEVPNANCIA